MFTFAVQLNGAGALAQLVEQRTENPCVTGSIPVGTTKAEYLIFNIGIPLFIWLKVCCWQVIQRNAILKLSVRTVSFSLLYLIP
jgi:hypothetical protein